MIGSLFSGYGGLDMAAEALGFGPTAWHCEIEAAPAKVLAHRWPGVPNLGDITAVDWTQVEPVDVITGGFPCQDISNAGKRAGIEGARSGLWSHYADAVRVLRPRLVLVENVGALLNGGLGRVLGDLAALGYDAQWRSVRASDAGAPHRRERIFIAAHAADHGHERPWPSWARGHGPADGSVAPAHSHPTEQPREHAHEHGTAAPAGSGGSSWGPYGPAVTRWERIIGRRAPAPTDSGRLNPSAVEWMMGLPRGWVTGVPGLSRSDKLKMLGNGVVPQQAILAFTALLTSEVAA